MNEHKTNRVFQVSIKITLAVLVLILLGLPILEVWKMLLLLFSWLALIYCDLHEKILRLASALFVVLILLIARNMLPTAGIEEGHNIFLYLNEGDVLQRTLPPPIFSDWRRSFDGLYPPETTPNDPFSWRTMRVVPESYFAYSSDSIWRSAHYSRRVDRIDFRNLGEFRGGFANDVRYNWWKGNVERRTMPFFVMYEFSDQSVGCILHWKGSMFWEKSDGSFDKIIHDNTSGKVISTEDIGRKAYMLCLPKALLALSVRLELSRKLRLSLIAINALSIIGVLCILGLMISVKWRPYISAVFLIVTSLLFIYLSVSVSDVKPLGALYPPHSGGDDGLFHESHGRDVARMAISGDIRGALEGSEPVYWFTPGMRYFRAAEKIVFGDTNLGYTVFLALLPFIIFLIFKHLCGIRWAWISTAIFIISPVSFSFAQYIYFALLGYSEPIGSGLFFIGLLLFLKSQPLWGGSGDRWLAFVGGGSLAASMFVRPNFALAVPLLGLFFLYESWRSRDFPLMLSAAAGLSLALGMPVHNYVYGHKFVLISASGASVSVPLSPLTYLKAAGELVTGNWQGLHIGQAGKQVWGWLWALPELRHFSRTVAVLFTLLRFPVLILTIFMAFTSRNKPNTLTALTWTAIAAQIPMLFIFDTQFRYAMLGWDLCILATLFMAARRFPDLPNRLSKLLIKNT